MASTELKASCRARLIVHGEHDAGDDLGDEAERQNAAERPQIVEIARRREVDELPVHQAHDRQALVPPLGERRLSARSSNCDHACRVPLSRS